jgi:hypothetical protein
MLVELEKKLVQVDWRVVGKYEKEFSIEIRNERTARETGCLTACRAINYHIAVFLYSTWTYNHGAAIFSCILRIGSASAFFVVVFCRSFEIMKTYCAALCVLPADLCFCPLSKKSIFARNATPRKIMVPI